VWDSSVQLEVVDKARCRYRGGEGAIAGEVTAGFRQGLEV